MMTGEQIQQLKQKLNETYVEREEQIDVMIDAFTKPENIWLYGLTGTGKSALFNDIAKALGYSVYHIDRKSSYYFLESFYEINNTYKFGVDINTPTILFLNHPYLWHESPDLIKAVVDIQHRNPESFPFSFIVAESLWEVSDRKTDWLADYFQQQIEFRDIQDAQNRIKALKIYSRKKKDLK